ncbi:hypothetical protein V6N13_066789 [Hibiscus sabdariffa]|uniref:Uncharacterized protein n=1 Tax=Hibiscus sabdariffa TaxID=183260 RepID=A0ABR2DRZ2_9ROSI
MVLCVLIKQDPKDVIIAFALEAMVERKRNEKRRMYELLRAAQVELRDKAKECEMLKRKKQSMLAKQASNQKLVDVFMLFIVIEAIDKNDVENVQKLAEKTMMDVILDMMNAGAGHNDNDNGFAADDGKKET